MCLARQRVSRTGISLRRSDINLAALPTYSWATPSLTATLPDETFMSAITIYTTPTCPYCQAAKALLTNKGLSYKEINMESDSAIALAMMKRTGRRSVPQIFVGDMHVGGFDDLNALETAGRLDPLLQANAIV